MNRTGKIIIGSALALGVVTLGIYIFGEIKKLKEGCVRLLMVRNLSFNKGINFTAILGFKNRSDLSLNLISQQYKVFVNDYHVADIKSPLEVTVKSHDETPISVDITIDPATTISAGLRNLGSLLLNQKEKIIISLKGSVSAKAGVVNVKEIPVDLKWTLKELTEPIKTEDSKC